MGIDAPVTSGQELGRRLAGPTPTIDVALAIDVVLAPVRQRAQVAGLH